MVFNGKISWMQCWFRWWHFAGYSGYLMLIFHGVQWDVHWHLGGLTPTRKELQDEEHPRLAWFFSFGYGEKMTWVMLT